MKPNSVLCLLGLAAVVFPVLGGCRPPADGLNDSSLDAAAVGYYTPLTYQNFDPASPEARRGLDYLFGGNILSVKGGVPLSLIKRAERLPPGKGQLDNLQNPVYQWERYGYPPSPPERRLGQLAQGQSLPVALAGFQFKDRRDVRSIVTNSCIACHTSIINSQVIAGAGNNQVYFKPVLEDIKSLRTLRRVLKVNPVWRVATSATEETYIDLAIDYFDLVLNPMLKWQTTRGAITGPASVLTYLTRMSTNMAASGLKDSLRKEQKNLILRDVEASPFQAPPTKAMPWWGIKYKDTLYRYPEKNGDTWDVTSQHFMDRHIGVSDAMASTHLPIVKDVLQYAREMRAPRYPGTLDADLVDKGERIFNKRKIKALAGKTCSSCHGTYKQENDTMEVDFPSYYGDVGTDSAVFEAGRYFMNLVKNRVSPKELPEYSDYPQTLGYLAPPLVGIWAAAPYLHNGSVPTLYAVLKSSSRPKVWGQTLNYAYDATNGGPAIVTEATTPAVEGQFYNTSLPGYGNGGHDFADGWDDADLYALVEYLKSLSD